MSTSNYPSANPQDQPKKKDSKNLIIGILAIGILASWAFILWSKNKNDYQITELTSRVGAIDSARNELQDSYNQALFRLDSLTGRNNEMEGQLSERNSEINKLKNEINSILRKQRLTEAEKKKAEALIDELNEKINGLEQEVQRLMAENTLLTQENATISVERDTYRAQRDTLESVKQSLEETVNIATTLNASNIAITPVRERNSGKEKVTDKAKRVDKLVISFDVSNRIVNPGSQEIYVAISDPQGKPVAVEALGSGTFSTRETGEKIYTTKLQVDLEPAKRKHVEFAWRQNSDFQKGNYNIEIYHNGFKIGEGIRELR